MSSTATRAVDGIAKTGTQIGSHECSGQGSGGQGPTFGPEARTTEQQQNHAQEVLEARERQAPPMEGITHGEEVDAETWVHINVDSQPGATRVTSGLFNGCAAMNLQVNQRWDEGTYVAGACVVMYS